MRADKLIGGLGGEKARWGQTVVDLNIAKDKLPGDCVVAAGMVTTALAGAVATLLSISFLGVCQRLLGL